MSKSASVIAEPNALKTSKPKNGIANNGVPRDTLKVVTKERYDKELARLQTELVRMQEWVITHNLKLMVIFEGRDTAGKGGTIKRIMERLNARYARVVALGTPTERERTQWYFQRYIQHLPAGGEIALFDRSWYNRAGVERVMDFCTPEEHEEFLRRCPTQCHPPPAFGDPVWRADPRRHRAPAAPAAGVHAATDRQPDLGHQAIRRRVTRPRRRRFALSGRPPAPEHHNKNPQRSNNEW